MKPLVFTPRTAAALWWLIFLVYACNVTFLLMLATAYLNYRDPDGWLSYMTFNLMYASSVDFLNENCLFIGAAYAMLTIPSLHGIFQMLVRLYPKRKVSDKNHRLTASAGQMTATKTATAMALILSSNHAFVSTMKVVMSSIGIRGAYFTPFLLTIETFEIALQTWQAYRTSKYISNPHINVLYGIAIFINCWSTAVIHHVWEHKYKHPLMARFLSALVDAILDFTWGVVFQGVLVWRYWSLERTMSALLVLLEVPENSDRELRQILVVSFSNFVLSGFPFLQTSIVLHELAFLLDDARISTINSRKSATEQSTLRGPAVPFRAILVETRLKRAFRRTIPHEIWRLSTIMLRIYHVCTMVYGAIILSISIAATGSNSVDGTGVTCQYRLYPWLTNSIYCVGRTIDCSKMGLMGSRNDLSNVLSSVNPYLLGNLVFANCEQLEIPSKVRDFTGLGTISIRNSTLTAWDDDAAVNQIFEELQTLQLVQVQVNCVPSGIMNQPFPESLEWVRFESITGEPFVPKVSDAWHSAVFFTCNDCQLLSIPAAVNSMTRVALYELKDNSLTTISGDCFVNKPSLTEIQLAGNPIEDLPIEAWALLNQLSWLDIRSTNISAIPTVDLSTANIVIYAYGSPLCAGSNSHTLPSQIVCDENSTVA